ncbi:5792_t:CDS:2, partial [Acaulospora colombiana]
MISNLFKEDSGDNEFSQLLEDLTSVAAFRLENNRLNKVAAQRRSTVPFTMSPLLTSTQKESGNTRDYISDAVSSSVYPPPAQDPQRVLRQMMSLCKHIYSRGLVEGSGSDVTIKAFDKEYHLHKIILYQNPYFSVLLEGPWKENGQKAIELRFDDENITRDAFEIALGRLYGRLDELILPSQVLGLLATSSFLDLQDLCEMCVEVILRDIRDETVVHYLTFATSHFYGPHSEKITESCFTYLCREGYESMRLKPAFLTLPAEWLKRVIESDAFWVPSEYERYLFARDIVGERRKISIEQKRLNLMTLSLENLELSELVNLPSDNSVSSSSTTPNIHKRLNDTYACHTRQAASTSTISSMCSISSSMHAESDETIYTAIFTYAIYYAHMTFEELNSILHDRDPIVNVPFAPDYVIKDALWQQIDLRNKIENAADTDGTLGISSSEIPSDSTGVHFEIPSDDTTHIGEPLTGLEDMVGGGNKVVKEGEGNKGSVEYSLFAPFRFSVEFSDVAKLKEKQRVQLEYVYPEDKDSSEGSTSPSIMSSNKSPTSSPGSDDRYPTSARLMKNNNDEKSFSRYADKRKTVRTWFKIFCPARGPSHVLTQFQSSPDNFALMQSWGWRSSSLCQDDYLLDIREYDGSAAATPNPASSTLKFSVVMGH